MVVGVDTMNSSAILVLQGVVVALLSLLLLGCVLYTCILKRRREGDAASISSAIYRDPGHEAVAKPLTIVAPVGKHIKSPGTRDAILYLNSVINNDILVPPSSPV